MSFRAFLQLMALIVGVRSLSEIQSEDLKFSGNG